VQNRTCAIKDRFQWLLRGRRAIGHFRL